MKIYINPRILFEIQLNIIINSILIKSEVLIKEYIERRNAGKEWSPGCDAGLGYK